MAFFFILVDTANEAVYELVAEPVQDLSHENRSQEKSLIKLPEKPLTLLTCKASPGA